MWRGLAAVMAMGVATGAASADVTVTVRAGDRDYRDTPVRCVVNAPRSFGSVRLTEGGEARPAQARALGGGRAEVTFLVPELKRGATATYRLAFEKAASPTAGGVTVTKLTDGDLDIRVAGRQFARYDVHTGPNKPYFYPIYGADGKEVTRPYPFQTVAGGSHDHPHHRGLWFTHGAVNGVDYWSEGPGTGKTVNTRFEDVMSGPVWGGFRAHTDWIDPTGRKVAEDVRDVRVYAVPGGALMDFDVTVRPVGGPLVFGDTKEGSFGIRLADSMRLKGGDGHIVSSTGVKDDDTWGKKADWVDYYGTVDGETVGLAILDNPANLRHPTPWHVRDYGLFAANPFGLHDFDNDKQHPHVGDYTVPADGSLAFRYRLLFHRGATADADIPAVWNGYADPPQVETR